MQAARFLGCPWHGVLTLPPSQMSSVRFLAAAAAALWHERTLDRAGLAKLQKRRLAELVNHAVTHVPLYTQLYAGMDAANAPLGALPPVSKSMVMQRFNESISDGALTLEAARAFGGNRATIGKLVDGSLVLNMTSGTTGHVGYFVTAQSTWERLRGTLFGRLLRHFLLNPFKVLKYGPWNRYRMAFVTATGGHYITYRLSLRNPWLSKLMMHLEAFSILTPLAEMCRGLNAYKPHFLHGYPTFMEALAHEQLQGRLNIHPEFVSLGSEPFTQSARAALQAAFPGAQIAETYGTTECVCIAAMCKFGKLHINEDICILESVDAQGNPVPDGKLGTRVLVTNLLNMAQPLIRYEVGDQVVVHAAGCECGSPLKSMKVLGRSDDTFYLKGEDNRFHAHTPVPFEVLFLEVLGMRQWQLVHETQNQLHVLYTREPDVTAEAVERALLEKFSAYLAQNSLGSTVKVRVEAVEEIPRDPNTRRSVRLSAASRRPPTRMS